MLTVRWTASVPNSDVEFHILGVSIFLFYHHCLNLILKACFILGFFFRLNGIYNASIIPHLGALCLICVVFIRTHTEGALIHQVLEGENGEWQRVEI